jgi:DNA-binding GntR family transcriptional regulator
MGQSIARLDKHLTEPGARQPVIIKEKRQERIARSSLHVEVADRVRDMIFDHSLPPGYRIEEVDLSVRLGTSRTPLREALKVLAQEGLVKLAPGRGAFVTELAPQEVDALFPVLAMLEARCAAEAVRRGNAADVRRLQAIHENMEAHVAAGDSEAYHRETDELHHRLHLMAANPWLLRAAGDLRRFLRLVRAMTPGPDGRLLHSLAEHRTLMKAIARGDADGAEQVMHHHLLSQQKAWRTGLLHRERDAVLRRKQDDAVQLKDAAEPVDPSGPASAALVDPAGPADVAKRVEAAERVEAPERIEAAEPADAGKRDNATEEMEAHESQGLVDAEAGTDFPTVVGVQERQPSFAGAASEIRLSI